MLASRAPDVDESQRLQALAEGYPGAEPEEADLLDLLLAFPSARPPVQELVSALGAAAAAALFDRVLAQSASRPRSISPWRRCASEKRGRWRTGVASTFLADARAARRQRAGLRAAARGFPPAGGRRRADDHDRAGHRHRAVPRLSAGAPSARRHAAATGCSSATSTAPRDFLYEDGARRLPSRRPADRLDLAFSRDQAERVYVQQRMRERAAELWAWLEDGAHLYVCGAVAMARDVDAALAAIIARQGGMGQGAAKAYLGEARARASAICGTSIDGANGIPNFSRLAGPHLPRNRLRQGRRPQGAHLRRLAYRRACRRWRSLWPAPERLLVERYRSSMNGGWWAPGR